MNHLLQYLYGKVHGEQVLWLSDIEFPNEDPSTTSLLQHGLYQSNFGEEQVTHRLEQIPYHRFLPAPPLKVLFNGETVRLPFEVRKRLGEYLWNPTRAQRFDCHDFRNEVWFGIPYDPNGGVFTDELTPEIGEGPGPLCLGVPDEETSCKFRYSHSALLLVPAPTPGHSVVVSIAGEDQPLCVTSLDAIMKAYKCTVAHRVMNVTFE